jgi:hypothetical protein
MDSEGLCHTPLLQNWLPTSSIIQVIETLVAVFSVTPPVLSVDDEEPPRPPQQVQMEPNPGPLMQESWEASGYLHPEPILIEPKIVFDHPGDSPPSYRASLSPTSLLERKLAEEYQRFSLEANKSIDLALQESHSLHRQSEQLQHYFDALNYDQVGRKCHWSICILT